MPDRLQLSRKSRTEDEPINKPAFCRAGFHCYKVSFRMITCAVWRCEWCGKRKVMSR
jgi:hypothetical protein